MMKKQVNIILVLLCLYGIVCGQSVSGHTLTIDKNSKSGKLTCLYPDSIRQVVFNGSQLKELDTSWQKLTNVKRIAFLNGSTVPLNLSFISGQEIEFTNYTKINIPKDFPFAHYKNIKFLFIKQLPASIGKFMNAEFLYIHETADSHLLEKIVGLSNIKNLSLSEVWPISSTFLCNFKKLESISLAMLKFENGTINLICLENLKSITIDGTNLCKLELNGARMSDILLNENYLLSSEEIKRIENQYGNDGINLVIWPKSK